MELKGPSTSLEKTVDVCISQVERANTSLDNIIWKLDTFEKKIMDFYGIKPEESLMLLLEDFALVLEDYDKLRQDLFEVHEMQLYVQDSIRDQAYYIQKKYRELRMKIRSRIFAD